MLWCICLRSINSGLELPQPSIPRIEAFVCGKILVRSGLCTEINGVDHHAVLGTEQDLWATRLHHLTECRACRGPWKSSLVPAIGSHELTKCHKLASDVSFFLEDLHIRQALLLLCFQHNRKRNSAISSKSRLQRFSQICLPLWIGPCNHGLAFPMMFTN